MSGGSDNQNSLLKTLSGDMGYSVPNSSYPANHLPYLPEMDWLGRQSEASQYGLKQPPKSTMPQDIMNYTAKIWPELEKALINQDRQRFKELVTQKSFGI